MTAPASSTTQSTWLVETSQNSDAGDDAMFAYPRVLVEYDDTDEDTADRTQLLATHDPLVYAQDREHSVGQLVDWFLRTGPARALDLHDQPGCAQLLRDLPEIDHRDAAEQPTLLRRYAATLKTGNDVMQAAAHTRQPPYAPASMSRPSSRPTLTGLVHEIRLDMYQLLRPIPSTAASWASHLLGSGVIDAHLVPGLTAESFAREIDMDLRNAFWDKVDRAFWVAHVSTPSDTGAPAAATTMP